MIEHAMVADRVSILLLEGAFKGRAAFCPCPVIESVRSIENNLILISDSQVRENPSGPFSAAIHPFPISLFSWFDLTYQQNRPARAARADLLGHHVRPQTPRRSALANSFGKK